MKRRRAGIAVAAVVAATSCHDEPELQRWRGEHLTYAHELGLTPCAGTRAHMDRVIPYFAGQLGLDAAARGDITYTWVSDDAWRVVVPRSIWRYSGFAHGPRAFSKQPQMVHELAHTVVHEAVSGGLPFFDEGLAEALEEAWTAEGYRRVRVDPRPQLFLEPPALDYAIAGAFASYLLSRHGPEAYLALLDGTRDGTREARLDAVFGNLYGGSVDSVVAEYLAADTCPEDTLPLPLPPSCAAPEHPWRATGRWVLARFLACDDDDAVGGRSDGLNLLDPRILTSVTLLVEESGSYDLGLGGDGAAIGLVRCGGCPWLREDVALVGDGQVSIDLEAGRYALTIYGSPEAHTQAIVTLDRTTP